MTAPQRFAGVDAWRAGLMLFGILLHALPEQSRAMPFLMIGYVSTHVRMGAFMVLAGFLCGLVASRRDRVAWLRARLQMLVMPLLTGLAITVPTLAILRVHFALTLPSIVSLWCNWYHLWFLVALLAYLPIACVLAFGDTHVRVARWLTGDATAPATRQARIVVAMTVGSLAMMTLGIRLGNIAPHVGPTLLNNLPQILGYAPLYAIGILLGRDGTLVAAVLDDWRTLAMLVATMALIDCGAAWASGAATGAALPQLSLLARSVLPGSSALLILRSALTVRSVPDVMRRVADASLTIYLVHFPIVKLLQALAGDVLGSDYLTFAFVASTAAILSYAFHARVVRRSPLLLWLFNGARRPDFGVWRRAA